MLQITQKRSSSVVKWSVAAIATACFASGIYMLVLISSPAIAPLIYVKPITVSSLPKPEKLENRIVIPKIGVNISYAPGEASLNKGAQWRYPERGNPKDGGNFIIAAHRLSIQATPASTVEKSPFYSVDKMAVNDKIVIDYDGVRYGYEIESIKRVKPTDVYIEDPSEEAKLTVYTCDLGGSDADRVVLIAKPLGKVQL